MAQGLNDLGQLVFRAIGHVETWPTALSPHSIQGDTADGFRLAELIDRVGRLVRDEILIAHRSLRVLGNTCERPRGNLRRCRTAYKKRLKPKIGSLRPHFLDSGLVHMNTELR